VTVTFVHAGTYRTEDKLKIQKNTETSTTKKSKQCKHSKTKLPRFSRLLRHWAYSTMLPSPHGTDGELKVTGPANENATSVEWQCFRRRWCQKHSCSCSFTY